MSKDGVTHTQIVDAPCAFCGFPQIVRIDARERAWSFSQRVCPRCVNGQNPIGPYQPPETDRE